MEKDVVLFDLDGTLLSIDFPAFLDKYFQALCFNFKDIAKSAKLMKILEKSTKDMLANTGKKTNKEVFMETFFSLINVAEPNSLMKRFNLFYKDVFPQLRKGLQIDTAPSILVDLLRDAGYQLVLATNAVFPLTAIIQRMQWAALNPEDFTFITSYENMHFCKPNLRFYEELVHKLDLEPKRCIMVGNDMQEDMIAKGIGISTYLVENFLIDRDTVDYKPDWRGTMDELISYFKKTSKVL